jgi:hypothetical protein
MPYVFSKLASQMGQQDDKQDIFGGGQPQQQGGGSQKSAGLKLTGDSGASVGAPPVSDTGSQKSLGLTQAAAGQSQAAMNQPTAGAANVFSDIGSAISKKQSALESEAESYGQKGEQAAAKSPDYSKDLEANVRSGKTGDIQKLLQTPYSSDIEEYQSGVSTSDIQIPKSQDQLASYLQERRGPEYSKGMSRLDAALLGQSSAFKTKQEELQSQKGQVEANLASQKASLTGQERRQAQNSYETKQKEVRDALTKMRENLIAAQNPEMEAFKKSYPSHRGSNEEAAQAYEMAANELAAEGKMFDRDALRSRFDVNQYYTPNVSGSMDDPMAFMDEGEASYYNNLAGLLGMTDTAVAGRQPTVGGGYDQARIKQAMSEALAGKGPVQPVGEFGQIEPNVTKPKDGKDYATKTLENWVIPSDGVTPQPPKKFKKLKDYVTRR